MRPEPLVTVAIPTFNRASLLGLCIESVLSQTMAQIEVIVSDNASEDDTAAVVESFGDSRVSYSPLDRNVGHLRNLSRCLQLGTAPFLAICQDDDLMAPHNIARKYELIRDEPGIVFVHSAFSFIDDEGRLIREKASWWDSTHRFEDGDEFIRGTLRNGLRVDLSSPLIRRAFVGDDHFEERDGLAADHGFFLRLGRKGTVAYIDEPLTASRRHGSSLSVSREAHLMEGGYYAPTFTYTGACRAINERFLDEFGGELGDTRRLRRTARRWARRDLAGVVRVNTRDDPTLGNTFRYVRRAVGIDPLVLVTRRVILVVGWALIGRRGRSVLERLRRTEV